MPEGIGIICEEIQWFLETPNVYFISSQGEYDSFQEQYIVFYTVCNNISIFLSEGLYAVEGL